MDKTLQLIVIAAIVLMTAGIMMFLVEDRSSGLGGFLDDRKQDANCQIQQTQFDQACNCSADPAEPTPKADSIFSNAESNGCSWANENNYGTGSQPYSCSIACG